MYLVGSNNELSIYVDFLTIIFVNTKNLHRMQLSLNIYNVQKERHT